VDPISAVIKESSTELLPLTISSNAFNNATSLYAESAGLRPLDEEVYRLWQIEDPHGKGWEVFDLPNATRAKLYNYYISRVRMLRVLRDQSRNMTGLPIHSERTMPY